MEQNLLQFIPPDFAERATAGGMKFLISSLIFVGWSNASLIVKKIICCLSADADPQKENVLSLIGSIARIAVLVFGFITALGTLGINRSALVAGLGLTGFALGFAFRDALSNLLAGVMILMYHPFYRGDQLSIIGMEGQVTRIDLRFITLQTEGKTFLIPNSFLLTNPVSLNAKSE